MKLTDRQRCRRDAGRDIGAEVLRAVRDMKAGKAVRTLQDCEQGRRNRTGAARSLPVVASKRPQVLRELLRELPDAA
jgi:putative transcriptional regulator